MVEVEAIFPNNKENRNIVKMKLSVSKCTTTCSRIRVRGENCKQGSSMNQVRQPATEIVTALLERDFLCWRWKKLPVVWFDLARMIFFLVIYFPFYLRQHANLGVLTTLRIGHDNTGKLSLSWGYTFAFFSLLSAYFVLLFFPHSSAFSYPNKEVWFSVPLRNRRWSISSLQINDKLKHRWRQ